MSLRSGFFRDVFVHLSVEVLALCHSDGDDFYIHVLYGFIQTFVAIFFCLFFFFAIEALIHDHCVHKGHLPHRFVFDRFFISFII